MHKNWPLFSKYILAFLMSLPSFPVTAQAKDEGFASGRAGAERLLFTTISKKVLDVLQVNHGLVNGAQQCLVAKASLESDKVQDVKIENGKYVLSDRDRRRHQKPQVIYTGPYTDGHILRAELTETLPLDIAECDRKIAGIYENIRVWHPKIRLRLLKYNVVSRTNVTAYLNLFFRKLQYMYGARKMELPPKWAPEQYFLEEENRAADTLPSYVDEAYYQEAQKQVLPFEKLDIDNPLGDSIPFHDEFKSLTDYDQFEYSTAERRDVIMGKHADGTKGTFGQGALDTLANKCIDYTVVQVSDPAANAGLYVAPMVQAGEKGYALPVKEFCNYFEVKFDEKEQHFFFKDLSHLTNRELQLLYHTTQAMRVKLAYNINSEEEEANKLFNIIRKAPYVGMVATTQPNLVTLAKIFTKMLKQAKATIREHNEFHQDLLSYKLGGILDAISFGKIGQAELRTLRLLNYSPVVKRLISRPCAPLGEGVEEVFETKNQNTPIRCTKEFRRMRSAFDYEGDIVPALKDMLGTAELQRIGWIIAGALAANTACMAPWGRVVSIGRAVLGINSFAKMRRLVKFKKGIRLSCMAISDVSINIGFMAHSYMEYLDFLDEVTQIYQGEDGILHDIEDFSSKKTMLYIDLITLPIGITGTFLLANKMNKVLFEDKVPRRMVEKINETRKRIFDRRAL